MFLTRVIGSTESFSFCVLSIIYFFGNMSKKIHLKKIKMACLQNVAVVVVVVVVVVVFDDAAAAVAVM